MAKNKDSVLWVSGNEEFLSINNEKLVSLL
jgi:hypothetical protein